MISNTHQLHLLTSITLLYLPESMGPLSWGKKGNCSKTRKGACLISPEVLHDLKTPATENKLILKGKLSSSTVVLKVQWSWHLVSQFIENAFSKDLSPRLRVTGWSPGIVVKLYYHHLQAHLMEVVPRIHHVNVALGKSQFKLWMTRWGSHEIPKSGP
jgi:hypothetical protein